MRPSEDKRESPIHVPVFPDPPFAGRRNPLDSDKHRIAELERENARLQKLVAELLLKNQQLRKPD